MNEHSPERAIVVEGLTKKFGDFTAVDGIQFSVNRGEIFGFLGPNGSGKTTTIRMTLGLVKPTAGEVSVLGLDVKRQAKAIRPRIGYMSQRFSLYNDLTVMQNLRFYGKAYGLAGELLESRITDAVTRSGLEGRERSITGELSGGWRQRLALSAALLHRPEVVFLDEPTAGVDPVSRRAFWDLLYESVAEGVTVFVTTHYMDEAEHCHRLAFIQRGRLIAQGSPADIKREMMPGAVIEIASSDAATTVRLLRAAAGAGRLPLEEVELYGSLVHVIVPAEQTRAGEAAGDNIIRSITQELRSEGVDPGDIAFIEPSLEDVFIACMQ